MNKITFAAIAVSILSVLTAQGHERVRLTRTPNDGIQPQAAIDERGVVHLIYYKGDPRSGDIFYTRRMGGEFSAPIRVNDRPGTAIAAGTIRGAQLSIGPDGRAHVIWNGNDFVNGSPDHVGAPLFYARLNDAGSAFEPQRDLITYAAGLDGGSSIAADPNGNVYAVWHAQIPEAPGGEKGRGVFVRKSSDHGKTFDREQLANTDEPGVCACCGLRAFAGPKGALYILYRAAFEPTERDAVLLVSKNGAPPFRSVLRHNWNIASCPMSSASLSAANGVTLASWETAGNVYWTTIDSAESKAAPFRSPEGGGNRKHPVAVSNGRGELLVAWTEGTGWQRGGKVAWQMYGSDGKPHGPKGTADGVPVWSLVTAIAHPDGQFEIIW